MANLSIEAPRLDTSPATLETPPFTGFSLGPPSTPAMFKSSREAHNAYQLYESLDTLISPSAILPGDALEVVGAPGSEMVVGPASPLSEERRRKIKRARVVKDIQTFEVVTAEGQAAESPLDKERVKLGERVRRFVAQMRGVQGDRQFTKWKGSVVDSIVGAFLTQNVSDHLSSSAYMSIAAKWPASPKQPNKGEDPKEVARSKVDLGSSAGTTRDAHVSSSCPVAYGKTDGSEETITAKGAADEGPHSDLPGTARNERVTEVVIETEADKGPDLQGPSTTGNNLQQANTLDRREPEGFAPRIPPVCDIEEAGGLRMGDSLFETGATRRPADVSNGCGKATRGPADVSNCSGEATRGGERPSAHLDGVDWEAVRAASVEEIADAIKERGMQTRLAERIKSFLEKVKGEHGCIDLEWLRDKPADFAREYINGLYGLGSKSAECILLLCLHQLAFPVDTNVGRICVRLGWVPLEPLDEEVQLHLLDQYPIQQRLQEYLWRRLSHLDQRELYELHYQLITFGKVFCTKRQPNCLACPMQHECKHYESAKAHKEQKLAPVNPSPSDQGPSHPSPSSDTPQSKRLNAPAVGGGYRRKRKERAPPMLSTGLMEGSEGTVGRVGGNWGDNGSGREAGGPRMRAWYTEYYATQCLPSTLQGSDGSCISSGKPALQLSGFSAVFGEGKPHKRHVAGSPASAVALSSQLNRHQSLAALDARAPMDSHVPLTPPSYSRLAFPSAHCPPPQKSTQRPLRVAQPRLARFTPRTVCPSLGAHWNSGPHWQAELPAGNGLILSAAQPQSGEAVWNGEGPLGQSLGREQAPVSERESLECLGLKWAGIGKCGFVPQPESADVQIRSGETGQLDGAQGANSGHLHLLCELQRRETSVTVHETASYTVEATETHSRQLRIIAKNSREPAPPNAGHHDSLARFPETHCRSQGEDLSFDCSRLLSPLGLSALEYTSKTGTRTDNCESVKSPTEPFHLRHCPDSVGTVDAGSEPGLTNPICSQVGYAQPQPAFEAQPDHIFSRLSPPLIEQGRMYVPIHTPAAQHAASSRYLQQIASRATRGRPVFVQSSEGSGRGWSVGAGTEEAARGGLPSWLTGTAGFPAAMSPLTSSNPFKQTSSASATLVTTDIGRIQTQVSPPLSPRFPAPDPPGLSHSHPYRIEHRPAPFLVPQNPPNRPNRETNQGMPTRLLDLNLPPTDFAEETARELQKTVKGAAIDARKRGVGRKRREPTIFWALPLKRPEKLRTVRHAVRLPDDHPLLQGFARRGENDSSPYFAVLWPTSIATCPPGPSQGSPKALPKASMPTSGDLQGEAAAVFPELQPDNPKADAGSAETNPPEPPPVDENGWTLKDEDGWLAECIDETDSALHSGGWFPTPELGASVEGIDLGFDIEALPQTLAESEAPRIGTPVEAFEQPCLDPVTVLFDRPSPGIFCDVEPGKAEGKPGKGEGQLRKLESQREEAEDQLLIDEAPKPDSVAAVAISTTEVLLSAATPFTVVRKPRSKRPRSFGGASWQNAVKAESDGGRGARQGLLGSESRQGEAAKVEADDTGLVILTRRQKRKLIGEKNGQLARASGESLAVCGGNEPALAGGCLEQQPVRICRNEAQQVVSVEDKPVVEILDKLTPRQREKAKNLDANHDSSVVRLKRIEHILRGLPAGRRKQAGKVKRAVAVPGWKGRRDRGLTGANLRKGGGKLCVLKRVRRNAMGGSRSTKKILTKEGNTSSKVRVKDAGLRSEPPVYETRARRATFENGSIADRVALGMRQRVKIEPQDDDTGTERDGENGPLGVGASQCGLKRDARVYGTESRKGGVKRLMGEGAGAGAKYRVKRERGASEGRSEETGGRKSVRRAGEGRAKGSTDSAEREAGKSNRSFRSLGKLKEEPMSGSGQPTLKNGKRFRAEVVDLRGTEEPEPRRRRALKVPVSLSLFLSFSTPCNKSGVEAGGSCEEDQKRSVNARPVSTEGLLVSTTSVDDALVQSDVPASATCQGELPPHKPVLPPEGPFTPAAQGDLLRLPRGGQGNASVPLLSVLYEDPALVRPENPAANLDPIVSDCTVAQLSEPSEDMQPPAAPANAFPHVIKTPNTQSSDGFTEEEPPSTAPADAPADDVSPPAADVTVRSDDGAPADDVSPPTADVRELSDDGTHAVLWPATPEKVRPVRKQLSPSLGEEKEAPGVAGGQEATGKGSPGEEQPGTPPSEEGTCTCSTCCCSQEETVFVTLLVPCRTALSGRFPLNGTYFQTNELFADHDSSCSPRTARAADFVGLPRSKVYFGTGASNMFKGCLLQEITDVFQKGYICVRGFDFGSRAPRPLATRLHAATTIKKV